MASATYTVEIDFDKDGTYGHASSDVSAYVLEMQWRNGMSSAEQEFANPATLQLTLSNAGGDFNPEDSGATFFGLIKKGLLVRIKANFASTDYTLYIGKIRETPYLAVGVYSDKRVQMTASGYMQELLQAEFQPMLETDVTTDAALKQPFDAGVVALPYASDYWILGSQDASTLGTDTFPVDATQSISFETGKTTMAYVGDASGSESTVRAQQFCRDVVAAEMGGRFWYDVRTGKFTFHHRHHDINPTSAVTFSGDDYEDVEYISQSLIYNHINIHFLPRTVGTPGSVIYTADSAISVPPGEVRKITARYQDPGETNAKVAALDPILPQRSVDYIANRAENGSGVDETSNASVSVIFGAQSAQLTLVNSNQKRRIWFTTVQLRGTPLKTYERQSVSVVEPDSIEDYDAHYETRSLRYVDDAETVQLYADSIASQYKDPLSRFHSIRLIANKTDARMTQALLRSVGDSIRVQFSAIGHDTTYIIVGEQHRVVGDGETSHETTWILKPTDRAQYWVLGVTGFSELGSTTIPAF